MNNKHICKVWLAHIFRWSRNVFPEKASNGFVSIWCSHRAWQLGQQFSSICAYTPHLAVSLLTSSQELYIWNQFFPSCMCYSYSSDVPDIYSPLANGGKPHTVIETPFQDFDPITLSWIDLWVTAPPKGGGFLRRRRNGTPEPKPKAILKGGKVALKFLVTRYEYQ